MLMPRPQYTTATNIHPRSMEHAIKMHQQQQHINQLMSTAAGGTGIVGDVDALLTPILHAPSQTPPPRLEARPERNLWRTDEIMKMLTIMQNVNALEQLNDKTVKSDKVFRDVEDIMIESGYNKKTHVQIWTKWKFLKSTYTTTKRNGTVPKMIPFPIYEVLHKMLGAGTSECGNSTASFDGDSSNGAGNSSAVGGRLIISGVEGGLSNGGKNNIGSSGGGGGGGGGDSEEESGFGMAHPIFGFRLGLVKQEPADTGYEKTPNNGNAPDDPLDDQNANSSCSSVAHIQFQTEIKQEVDDDESYSPPPELKKKLQQQTPELLMNKRPVRITPLTQAAQSKTAAALSPVPATRNPQLPPLRIAPFAKVPPGANGEIEPSNRPPPPLSMHPAHRMSARMNPNHVVGNMHYSQPKLLPKPAPIQIGPRPIRLHSAANVPQRPPTITNSTGMLRLKSVPMRKTPYSLRPDRMIPDLDASLSPPAMPQRKTQYPIYPSTVDSPSTSQKALHSMQNSSRIPAMLSKNQKRSLEISWQNSTPNMHPTKIPRIYAPSNASSDDDEDNSSMFDSASIQRQSFKEALQQSTPGHQKSFKPSRKEQEFFDSALKDLGVSMRQMQRELIHEFFEKQMALAREEHEFQMKQDALLMEAFTEQTQSLKQMAKQMLGVDLGELAGTQKGTPSKEEAEIKEKVEEKTAVPIVNAAQTESEDEDDEETIEEGAAEIENDGDTQDNEQSEDDEYMQDNINEHHEEEEEEEDDSDDENDSNEEGEAVAENVDEDENDEEDEYDDDNMADPILLVSSELTEDN